MDQDDSGKKKKRKARRVNSPERIEQRRKGRSPEEVRALLKYFHAELEETFRTALIPTESMRYAAAAFKTWIEGGAKSLDEAFGLKRRKGAPSKDAKHLQTAILIAEAGFRGMKDGKPILDWDAVLAKLPEKDKRELERVWDAFGAKALPLALAGFLKERDTAKGKRLEARIKRLVTERDRHRQAGNWKAFARIQFLIERAQIPPSQGRAQTFKRMREK